MAQGLGWDRGRDTHRYPPTAKEANPASAGSEEGTVQPPPRGISSWQGLACSSGDLSGYPEEHVRQGRLEDVPDLCLKKENNFSRLLGNDKGDVKEKKNDSPENL